MVRLSLRNCSFFFRLFFLLSIEKRKFIKKTNQIKRQDNEFFFNYWFYLCGLFVGVNDKEINFSFLTVSNLPQTLDYHFNTVITGL